MNLKYPVNVGVCQEVAKSWRVKSTIIIKSTIIRFHSLLTMFFSSHEEAMMVHTILIPDKIVSFGQGENEF